MCGGGGPPHPLLEKKLVGHVRTWGGARVLLPLQSPSSGIPAPRYDRLEGPHRARLLWELGDRQFFR